jgi:predicted RNase H-like nuclease
LTVAEQVFLQFSWLQKPKKNCDWGVGLFPKLYSLIDILITKYEQIEPLILLDIPIGLKNGGKGELLPDFGAHRILKARKSSRFPIPCREAVYMEAIKKPVKLTKSLQEKASQNRHGI